MTTLTKIETQTEHIILPIQSRGPMQANEYKEIDLSHVTYLIAFSVGADVWGYELDLEQGAVNFQLAFTHGELHGRTAFEVERWLKGDLMRWEMTPTFRRHAPAAVDLERVISLSPYALQVWLRWHDIDFSSSPIPSSHHEGRGCTEPCELCAALCAEEVAT